MSKVNPTDPAIPFFQPNQTEYGDAMDITGGRYIHFSTGMPIRLQIAAMAMNGLLASGIFTEKSIQAQLEKEAPGSTVQDLVAGSALILADSLISKYNRSYETP